MLLYLFLYVLIPTIFVGYYQYQIAGMDRANVITKSGKAKLLAVQQMFCLQLGSICSLLEIEKKQPILSCKWSFSR
jgi:hypothetical protein